jgi:hypothetical protein
MLLLARHRRSWGGAAALVLGFWITGCGQSETSTTGGGGGTSTESTTTSAGGGGGGGDEGPPGGPPQSFGEGGETKCATSIGELVGDIEVLGDGVHVTGVALDPEGNAVVVASVQGAVDFDGEQLPAGGGYDVFVGKWDPDCQPVWRLRVGGSGDQSPYSVAADSAGNVYVGGAFLGKLSFGGDPLVTGSQPPSGYLSNGAAFLAKLDPEGKVLWQKAFGLQQNAQIDSIAVDADDDVIVAGKFEGDIDFGGEVLEGWSSGFLAKLDPDGNHLFSRAFATETNTKLVDSVSVSVGAGLSIGGTLDGTADLGGGPISSMEPSWDTFAARLDADGNHLWSTTFPSPGFGDGGEVAIDAEGRVAVARTFDEAEIFVDLFNADGQLAWSKAVGFQEGFTSQHVCFDGHGDVLVAGGFDGVADFGGGELDATNSGLGASYVAKLTIEGDHVFSRRFGGPSAVIAVAGGPDGDAVVVGAFLVEIDLEGVKLTSHGLYNGYLARLAP